MNKIKVNKKGIKKITTFMSLNHALKYIDDEK